MPISNNTEAPLVRPTAHTPIAHQRPAHLRYWNVDADRPRLAKQTYSKPKADDDTPLVFYFGGIPVMNMANQPPEQAICSEILSYLKTFSPTKYNLTFVTESSGHDKYDMAGTYNADPQHYASANAQEFVDHALMPLIENAQNVQDIKTQFSRVNMIGHSYGTAFIQNVSNALRSSLKERTRLSDDEIAHSMQCIAALNIAPDCTVVKKPADFSQIFTVSDSDQVVPESAKYREIVTDDHPLLGHQRVGSNLVLMARNIGKHVLKLSANEQGIAHSSQTDDSGHSLRIHMNVTGNLKTRFGDEIRTFQVNPAAGIVREHLNEMVGSSLESARLAQPRDMGATLNRIERNHLTDSGKAAIMDQMHRDKNSMAKFLIHHGSPSAER